MSPVELEQAREHLDELVEQASRGEEVVIMRNSRPLARLVPLRSRKARQFGSAKGLIEIADDFDAPLEDFRDYV
jgi:prevent-host-death family protein